ncbi:MAG: DUF5693 family protein [Synergistaceae bacterium]|jgi:hypothetical protein|nr:DUF5693 family protein [Synergistaceae bacterium]
MPIIWEDKESDNAEAENPIRGREHDDRSGHLVTLGYAKDRPKRPFCSMERFFWVTLLIAVLLSGGDLFRRLVVERRHRVVAIVIEYRDLVLLSRQAGENPEAVFAQMRERGVIGITAAEFTGKDLASGVAPLSYGPLASYPAAVRNGIEAPLDSAALLIDNSYSNLKDVIDFLRIRTKGALIRALASNTLIVLPNSLDELSDAGVLPDFSALEFAEKVQAVSLYRPAPAPGVDGVRTAESIRWLKNKYPLIASVVPAGQIVAGYPDIGPVARVLKELGITVAQAEFVRQIGMSEFLSAVRPSILPLHSLVKDELISRRMTRDQVVERMVRAAHERSIRIILLRPYELYSVGKLAPFLEDAERIRDSLYMKGYTSGWPDTIPMFRASILAAIALAAVFLVTLWSYVRRYTNTASREVSYAELILICICAAALGLAVWKISIVSRLLGGLCSALVATEAVLWALDRYKKLFEGMLAGLLIVLAGGLTVAAFYGTTTSMLRLTPFSGVKLTLLLPPVLVLANDLKRRIHPESMRDMLSRPPVWGELALVGILMIGAVIMTIRSDNVSFVPGWEAHARDMLERILWIRPRTKEFLVGYPCIFIYYILRRRNWAIHYREVLRIGASLAYSSALNTFTHFHTLLPLTVVRVVNGWWLGIVVGFVVLILMDYIVVPIWKIGGRTLFD